MVLKMVSNTACARFLFWSLFNCNLKWFVTASILIFGTSVACCGDVIIVTSLSLLTVLFSVFAALRKDPYSSIVRLVLYDTPVTGCTYAKYKMDHIFRSMHIWLFCCIIYIKRFHF
eukprot:523277_1